MTVSSKTFITSATEGTSGLAADIKTYMDAITPVANGSFEVTSTGIGNGQVLTLVVIQTA